MSDVFYLRPIEPPVTPQDVQAMAQHAGGCFDLHRVDWKQSFLAADGGRMLCWYEAPDAESARLALRQLGSDMNCVWAGTVVGDVPEAEAFRSAAVAAEIALDAPLADDERERRMSRLRQRGVMPVCGFVSARGTKLVYLFAASGLQSDGAGGVEAALEDAGLRAERVWACVPVTPFPAAGRAAQPSSNPA